jgi:hypothetical protein
VPINIPEAGYATPSTLRSLELGETRHNADLKALQVFSTLYTRPRFWARAPRSTGKVQYGRAARRVSSVLVAFRLRAWPRVVRRLGIKVRIMVEEREITSPGWAAGVQGTNEAKLFDARDVCRFRVVPPRLV